jgi:hypothetical protein
MHFGEPKEGKLRGFGLHICKSQNVVDLYRLSAHHSFSNVVIDEE